jgi:bacterioferritin-associated ferredoxin
LGFGLRSETQLADLAGCAFVFDARQRQWLPQRDADGRTAVPGIYIAGDGAGIRGADAAELAGARAALALLDDLGLPGEGGGRGRLARRLAREAVFRRGIERGFPIPADIASQAPDALMICRCEGVTAGAVRAAVRDLGAVELNRVKAFTRLGMGRCQGRYCALGAAEIVAAARGATLEQAGRLRGQAPIKPIPIA